MSRYFVTIILSFLLLAQACNRSPSKNDDNGDNGTPPPPSSNTPSPRSIPNLRTGLTPDPPSVKEGEPAFASQDPKTKSAGGEMIGDMTGLDKLPLAYITFKGTGEWCSGILATDEDAKSYIVLTAAHCFWDDNKRFYEPKDVFILNKAGGWTKAEHVFYERSDIDIAEYKDIGLIRLKNDPPVNTYKPIAVAVRAQSPDPHAQAVWETKELKTGTEVYSWGYTSRRWIKRQTIKMTGAQLWGNDAGRDMRRWVIPTKYAQAYGGDSGGPLLMKFDGAWHIVGVLQGFKPEALYTDEPTITFTWVDGYMQNVWDANADRFSIGVPVPVQLDAAKLQDYR